MARSSTGVVGVVSIQLTGSFIVTYAGRHFRWERGPACVERLVRSRWRKRLKHFSVKAEKTEALQDLIRAPLTDAGKWWSGQAGRKRTGCVL